MLEEYERQRTEGGTERQVATVSPIVWHSLYTGEWMLLQSGSCGLWWKTTPPAFMCRRSVIYMYMTGIRVLLSPTLREDVREEALSKVTFQKKSLPPTNEAFHLTVTELHRSVFLCWMTLVGLDIHHCMRVIQLHLYCLCQLCLTQYCLFSQLWLHMHMCICGI